MLDAPPVTETRWLELLRAVSAVAPDAVVWKNADRALAGDGDVDVLVPMGRFDAIERAFLSWARAFATAPVMTCRHAPGAMLLVAFDGARRWDLDCKAAVTHRARVIVRAEDAAALSVDDARGFRRLPGGAEGLFKLIAIGASRTGEARDEKLAAEDVRALLADRAGAAAAARVLGTASLRAADACARGEWDQAAVDRALRRGAARALAFPRLLGSRAWSRFVSSRECRGLKRELGDALPDEAVRTIAMRHYGRGSVAVPRARRGGAIVIAGPDGTGKSTLALRLLEEGLDGLPTRRSHHSDGVGLLPRRRNPKGPASQPHRHAAYPGPLSTLKYGYLWLDFALGSLARVVPFVRRGGWFVLERWWWDLAVDPLRYRLRPAPRIARALGRLLPRPDLILVLEAPPEVIAGRKDELPPDELRRQAAAWRGRFPARAGVVVLDASRPAADVYAQAMEAVARTLASRERGWVALPSRANPRFVVPRAPARVASRALRLYQPMTVRGLVGWGVARAAARAGALRILPRARPDLPPVPGVPPDAALASAGTMHEGRSIVVALDRRAEIAVAKVGDPDAVAREERGLALAARLTPPLAAPRVRTRTGDALVLEPLAWRPRLRPWVLPTDVAAALGRLWRDGVEHGDVAPWNLMRTRDGWALIDWEYARAGGEPFGDVLHHLALSHALLGRPSRRGVLAAMEGRGWAGRAIAAYARAAGLDPVGARAALAPMLRAELARLAEAPARDDVVRARTAWAALLAALEGQR